MKKPRFQRKLRPKRVTTPTRVRSKPKASRPPTRTPQRPTNNALAAFASFNKLNTLSPKKVSSNFKIDPRAPRRKNINSGKNLVSSLNQINAPTSNSAKSALSNVSTDFSNKNLSNKTGRRRVKGAPVGSPKLLNSPNRTQGLTSSQVMAIVNKHLSEVQRCYERALFNQPNLAGRIEYEWTISSRGKVKSVNVRRSEMSGDQYLNKCVKKVFVRMRFPTATNGQSTVGSIGFPFGKL